MTQPVNRVPVIGAADRTRLRLDEDGADLEGLAKVELGRGRRLPTLPTEALPESTDVIGLLTDLAEPARVADVDCGQGMAVINLAVAYPQITGVGFASDPADLPTAQDNAVSAGVADRVTFALLEGRSSFSAMGPFDVVFFFGIVQVMGHPRLALDQARATLTDRGVVVIVSPGAAEETQVGEGDAGDDEGPPGRVMDLDPAEQVQVYFPDARVLWCPPPSEFEPGLDDQRGKTRPPEETRAWLTRRVEVSGDGMGSLGTHEGPDL